MIRPPVLLLFLGALPVFPLAVSPAPASSQASAPARTPELREAIENLRVGRYSDAVRALESMARGPGASPETLRAYARALMEVGRYEEVIRTFQDESPRALGTEVANVLGEAHVALGQVEKARNSFQRSWRGGATDRHRARLNLGILLWDQGEREEALAIFDSFIDLYNTSRARLSAEDLMAVGTAVRYLGGKDPALYQDALMAFDDAAEVAPEDPRPDLLAGELFLEKYRATDARESFKPVLERNPRHPRALLGQARILDFEGAGGSVDLVRQALEVNPHYVEARAFLAELFLRTEDFPGARREALEALETNPVHLGALSILAATHFLEDDQDAYEGVRDRVLALNPTYPGLYLQVAEAAAARRQYSKAAELAGRGVQVDPSSWRSYGLLGMNQLRIGAIEEGRRNLETAFQGDPYNPWYKNSLDLLDTFHRYETVETENFRIFLHQSEASLLGPYAASFAEEAFSALEARYGSVPPTPVRLEIYPSHADFSVRTLGLTGLGALGVSFGSTLVMDSPSAKEPGAFNWASTAWHEIAHAFHLAMSDHRVPRWFTEGLAVHEQKRARVRWGQKVTPAWLGAYESGRLHPVSRLNQGFVRPDYPEQVIFSYYQASLVLELIEDRWGLDAILAMLEGYRQGKSNDRVFQEVLGQSPTAFDRVFEEYVEGRWGSRMPSVITGRDGEGATQFHGVGVGLESARRRAEENPGSFLARLALGRALMQEGLYDDAEGELKAALALFPEYAGPDSPYRLLATLHRQRGESERAAMALQRLGDLGETAYEAHLEEAEIWLELGDSVAAARALEKVVEIVPFQVEPHGRLAGIYEALGELDGAIRERRAVLALDPTDRADAHFRLAGALAEGGKRTEARREVLKALELAPSFEPALELLLELRGGGEENRRPTQSSIGAPSAGSLDGSWRPDVGPGRWP